MQRVLKCLSPSSSLSRNLCNRPFVKKKSHLRLLKAEEEGIRETEKIHSNVSCEGGLLLCMVGGGGCGQYL